MQKRGRNQRIFKAFRAQNQLSKAQPTDYQPTANTTRFPNSKSFSHVHIIRKCREDTQKQSVSKTAISLTNRQMHQQILLRISIKFIKSDTSQFRHLLREKRQKTACTHLHSLINQHRNSMFFRRFSCFIIKLCNFGAIYCTYSCHSGSIITSSK